MRNPIIIYLLLLVLSAGAQNRNLEFYQNKALENSPLINKKINDNKLIKINLQQINSILKKPQINVEANILFAPIVSHYNNYNKFRWVADVAKDYTGYDMAFSDGGQYTGLVRVDQPIFRGNIFDAYSRSADVSNKINENDINLTNHEIDQLISHQYILCLKEKKQMEISERLISDIQSQLNTLQKLVEKAIYKQTDLMLLEIEFQNYQLMYSTHHANYQNNISDLNLLCGINDTIWVDLTDTNFSLTPSNSEQSNFLKSFKLDSLHIISNQQIFEQRYKPRLGFYATAGMSAIYLPSLNRLGFSTGLNFTWNIFDGHQKNYERKKSKIKLQTIDFDQQNFVLQNSMNKNKYLTNIKSLNQRIKVTNNQLKEYEKLLHLYSMEISQAQISIMDLKNLFKDIATKKQENLILKMEEQILINSYNYWNF